MDMSEMKKVATLESVVFNYPAGNNALDKITLDLFQGEIVGMVGANGAGKTTLMKILAGYMDKSDGVIHYNGRPIEEFSNKRLNEFVNLVEQNPESQLVGPTVEDELARACRLMGYEGRVIREKVDFVLKLVRMKQAKEWYLDEMSCGERRRIALAMALIADPSILLLDEPLSDLDQVGVKDTVATLKELKNRGLCIIVSAHRLEDILELTDRIAVLGEGRLLMIDEPEKVLSNDEILKLATITLPAIPKLFMRLQAEGILASNKVPLSIDQAVDRIREAVSLRVEATQSLRAMPDPDRASKAEATSRMEKAEPAGKGGESASEATAQSGAAETAKAFGKSETAGGSAGESEVDVNKTLVLSKESVASKLSI
jgi:energy-coupling factor transporter ATP-binding protein EcfA2